MLEVWLVILYIVVNWGYFYLLRLILQNMLLFRCLFVCRSTHCLSINVFYFLAGIVEVNLYRPKNKNAIDTKLMRGLKHALELIHQDSSANVAIITSSVAGVYCAGADLKVTYIEQEEGISNNVFIC